MSALEAAKIHMLETRPMEPSIIFMILFAAVLHAGWNTLIKISGDALSMMALVTLAGAFVSILALPFVEAPDPAVWPILILSILVHTGYNILLPMAYKHGDLGQVYPIARGSAPILVTIGAMFFVGEYVSPIAMVGIIALSIGVMALTMEKTNGKFINTKATILALATGMFIATYTVIDGIGARGAGSVLGFAVWLTIGDGVLTFLIALAIKKKALWQAAKSNMGKSFIGGTMQVAAYWIIIWALATAPMGMVSALRETSVLLAALISMFLLKEGFGAWRFISAILVTAGLMLSQTQK